MKETIRVLLSEEEVDRRIKEVADQINRDYAGKEVHLICVLKGGVFFMCELAKRITVPVSLDFMSVSSYGDDTKSSGVVRIVKDLDQPLEGKDVLIVEDIIDSGRTLYYLIDILKKRNPKSVHLCTLLDKPERRVRDVKVDYTCFNIPDEFVVGYGLDYAQKYRSSGVSRRRGVKRKYEQTAQWIWTLRGVYGDYRACHVLHHRKNQRRQQPKSAEI